MESHMGQDEQCPGPALALETVAVLGSHRSVLMSPGQQSSLWPVLPPTPGQQAQGCTAPSPGL